MGCMGLILRLKEIREMEAHVRWYCLLGLRGCSSWLSWELGRQRRGRIGNEVQRATRSLAWPGSQCG